MPASRACLGIGTNRRMHARTHVQRYPAGDHIRTVRHLEVVIILAADSCVRQVDRQAGGRAGGQTEADGGVPDGTVSPHQSRLVSRTPADTAPTVTTPYPVPYHTIPIPYHTIPYTLLVTRGASPSESDGEGQRGCVCMGYVSPT